MFQNFTGNLGNMEIYEWDKNIFHNELNTEQLFKRGREKFRAGIVSDAMIYYYQIFRKAGKGLRIYNNIIACHYSLGNYNFAYELTQKAKKLFQMEKSRMKEKDFTLHVNRTYYYEILSIMALGKFEGARHLIKMNFKGKTREKLRKMRTNMMLQRLEGKYNFLSILNKEKDYHVSEYNGKFSFSYDDISKVEKFKDNHPDDLRGRRTGDGVILGLVASDNIKSGELIFCQKSLHPHDMPKKNQISPLFLFFSLEKWDVMGSFNRDCREYVETKIKKLSIITMEDISLFMNGFRRCIGTGNVGAFHFIGVLKKYNEKISQNEVVNEIEYFPESSHFSNPFNSLHIHCRPNAYEFYLHDFIFVVAMEDIKKGDFITSKFMLPSSSFFYKDFSKNCTCKFCVRDLKKFSNGDIRKIEMLMKLLNEGKIPSEKGEIRQRFSKIEMKTSQLLKKFKFNPFFVVILEEIILKLVYAYGKSVSMNNVLAFSFSYKLATKFYFDLLDAYKKNPSFFFAFAQTNNTIWKFVYDPHLRVKAFGLFEKLVHRTYGENGVVLFRGFSQDDSRQKNSDSPFAISFSKQIEEMNIKKEKEKAKRKKNEDKEYKCAVCSSRTKLKKCTRCFSIRYCGVKCQKKHWKIHKLVCRVNRFMEEK